MKNKNNSGEVIVEASIIVTMVALFITVLLYISMVLYQQTMMSVVANQTASNIAQVYSNSLKDPFTGYIDHDNVYQSISYTSMKDDAYREVLEKKADALAKYRLKSSSILAAESTSVEVDVVKKPNELLKSQIVVTIRNTYNVPLVEIFDQDGVVEFATSGRADCVDLLEYLTGVEAIGNTEDSSVFPVPDFDSCVVTFVRDKLSGKFISAQPVERGKSISSSSQYTHSEMPKTPVYGKLKFLGWETSNGNGFSKTTPVNENLTVYGRWECTVSFNPTGGTVNPKQKTVELGKTVKLPIPKRDHYSFSGWYTGKNATGTRYYDNTVITGDITLYAAWECVHAYKEIERVGGNCITNGYVKYQCDNPECRHTYTSSSGKGNHNFVNAGKEGEYCYNTYLVYKCTFCGEKNRTSTEGKHNYVARCEDGHRVTAGKFKCSVYNFKPGPCKTTRMYHYTCEFCGDKEIFSTYSNGKLITSETYMCGVHKRGIKSMKTTGCGHSGSKK